MKVVQLLPELQQGGVERGVVELNRELVKRGVESVVVSAGGRLSAQIDADGGRHYQFDLASKNLLSVPFRSYRLRRLLQEIKPDLLHARSRVPAWLAYLANKSLKIPFVTTVHGFNSVNPYSRVMTFGEPVICVSHAIKDFIQLHYNVPDTKLKIIPRGVDLTEFDPTRTDKRVIRKFTQEYQLKGKFVVTSVGRVTQLKDFETFIRGVASARETIPNIIGLIIGGVRQDKQKYYCKLRQLVRDLGADDYIKFAGSQQNIAEFYMVSDVVVSSSRKPESFGRTAAEALAMDVPVIATKHGGVLDIIEDGNNGWLFPCGDAVRLAECIIKLDQLSRKSMRLMVSERFSLKSMVDGYSDIYNQLHRNLE